MGKQMFRNLHIGEFSVLRRCAARLDLRATPEKHTPQGVWLVKDWNRKTWDAAAAAPGGSDQDEIRPGVLRSRER